MAPASWEKRRVGQGAMLLTWIDVHSDNDMHHHCLNNVAEVGSDEHRMEGVLTVVSSITQQRMTIFECHSSFGCHITVGDMAPRFRVREISDEGKVSLPGPPHSIIVVPMASFHHRPVSQQGELG